MNVRNFIASILLTPPRFLLSFKGTFEFDLKINVNSLANWSLFVKIGISFSKIRGYLLLNIGVFESFF